METIKSTVGILRQFLVFFTLLISVTGLFSAPSSELEGWPIITSKVAPSLAVMIAFALMLDIAMSYVFRIDSSMQDKQRLFKIIKIEFSCLLILVSCWVPFFNRLALDSIA